jgi:hypothetical protein
LTNLTWNTVSGGGGGLQTYWINLNYVVSYTGVANVVLSNAAVGSFFSSITCTPSLPSNWSVTANTSSMTAGNNPLIFTNRNVSNASESYLATPVFLNTLTATMGAVASTSNNYFLNWISSPTYYSCGQAWLSPFITGGVCAAAQPPGNYSTFMIRNGTSLSAATANAGGWGAHSVGNTTGQFSISGSWTGTSSFPSTFFVGVRLQVMLNS